MKPHGLVAMPIGRKSSELTMVAIRCVLLRVCQVHRSAPDLLGADVDYVEWARIVRLDVC